LAEDEFMARDSKLADAYKAFADRRRDPDGKREAILRTALQLFLERGYGRTSLNDIAQQLKITKPALYHYFRNKDDILLECYRWGCMLIREFLDEIAAHPGSGIDKVTAFIQSYTTVISADFGRAVIRLDDNELSPDARAEVRSYKKEIDRRLRLFLQEGIEDGSIAPCDIKLASFTIAGAMNGISVWFKPGGGLTSEQVAATFVQILTEGLRSEAARRGGAGQIQAPNLRLISRKAAKKRGRPNLMR
jgi:AcrR family transcriptional regulator